MRWSARTSRTEPCARPWRPLRPISTPSATCTPRPPTAGAWRRRSPGALSPRPATRRREGSMRVELKVNDATVMVDVEPRRTLLDCLREDLRLTGTNAGCEHGVCGACTVLIDGEPVRSCLMLA